MRKVATVVLMSLAASGAYGDDQSPHKFGGDVAITSDYVFRGITNSDNKPAVQGDVTYSYTPLGIYASLWASSISLGPGIDPIETDWTAGISGPFFGTALTYDLGNVYYYYPGENSGTNADYDEVYFGLDYTFDKVQFSPDVGAKVYYSPDFFGATGSAYYIDGHVSFSLPYDFSLNTHIGHQYVEHGSINVAGASVDYTDWKVGLSKSLFGFGLDVSYTDTTDAISSGTHGFVSPSARSTAGSKVTFTISRGF